MTPTRSEGLRPPIPIEGGHFSGARSERGLIGLSFAFLVSTTRRGNDANGAVIHA